MNGRYSRQIALRGFGKGGQDKLSAASVLVIGAGGLGCPALQYLAGAGIGHIGIADGDRVSLSNLHRQVLYDSEDIGKPKAEVAFKKLTAANPELRIESYPFKIDVNNGLRILENYEIILDCSDNFETRYLVNDACTLLDKPLIFAAVSAWEGQLAIFHRTADRAVRTNYRDLFPIQPGQNEVASCEENGVIGVLPGILGTMQAAEAIKLITDTGDPLINQLLNYNLLKQSVYTINIVPAPPGTYILPQSRTAFSQLQYQAPPVKNENDAITEIGMDELMELSGKASTLLIDVRESYESPAITLRHIQVPMSAFEAMLPASIAEENIVFICQHGGRSIAAATKFVSSHRSNKNIYSLAGGVARWTAQLTTENE